MEKSSKEKITIFFKGEDSLIQTKVVSKEDFLFWKKFFEHELKITQCKCLKKD